MELALHIQEKRVKLHLFFFGIREFSAQELKDHGSENIILQKSCLLSETGAFIAHPYAAPDSQLFLPPKLLKSTPGAKMKSIFTLRSVKPWKMTSQVGNLKPSKLSGKVANLISAGLHLQFKGSGMNQCTQFPAACILIIRIHSITVLKNLQPLLEVGLVLWQAQTISPLLHQLT